MIWRFQPGSRTINNNLIHCRWVSDFKVPVRQTNFRRRKHVRSPWTESVCWLGVCEVLPRFLLNCCFSERCPASVCVRVCWLELGVLSVTNTGVKCTTDDVHATRALMFEQLLRHSEQLRLKQLWSLLKYTSGLQTRPKIFSTGRFEIRICSANAYSTHDITQRAFQLRNCNACWTYWICICTSWLRINTHIICGFLPSSQSCCWPARETAARNRTSCLKREGSNRFYAVCQIHVLTCNLSEEREQDTFLHECLFIVLPQNPV